MSSSRTWQNLKAPCAIIAVLAALLTALYFAPPLIPLPDPPSYDRNEDIIRHLKDSPQTAPLAAEELHRFRELNRVGIDYATNPLLFEKESVLEEMVRRLLSADGARSRPAIRINSVT